MKITTSLTLALTFCAGTAFAGSLETPVIPTVTLASPTITDWSGFYVGGTYSANSGTGDYHYAVAADVFDQPLSGPLYGVYAGYNMQRGSFVYGAELAYQTGAVDFDWAVAPETAEVSNILDAKLRAGLAVGNALIYGVAGYTSGKYEEATGGSVTYSTNMTGFSYGAGAEMKLGQNMVVGVEYLLRELSDANDVGLPESTDLHLDTIQLRVGWQF